MPCTNCLAFSIECIASTKKRRKVDPAEPDEVALYGIFFSYYHDYDYKADPPSRFQSHENCTPVNESTTASPHPMEMLQQQLMQDSIDMDLYAKYLKPGIRQAPIKEPGRVAYLGESSNFPLLLDNSSARTEVVHYQLPESYRDSRVKLAKLDKVEMESLHRKGALSLPPWRLCDDLVESFFIWVAPIVPVINRGRFMKQYQDPSNPPSLLLLQAIFLAGSRVCTNAHLLDSDREHSALTFYKRAKALYDAGYEDDRIIIIQALILMGWYWEKSGDGIGNVFYWNGLATTIAQGSGIHRSTEKSFMSKTDKRLWKRIWWTLFTRDRSVAVALGQPVQINTDDSDVEMVCEDDFLDEEYPPNPIAVQFFLQYVKLWRIMSFVPAQPDSLTVKAIRHNPSAFTQCDAALAQWLQECPEEMKWKESRYNFWSALLNCSYQTTISLLHQPDAPSSPSSYDSWSTQHLRHPTSSSQNVAFQAACKITSIVESMIVHNELRFSPAFMYAQNLSP